MLLQDILKNKTQGVVSVPTGTRVIDAVKRMVDSKIGAILVVNGDEILGVFTERDHLRFTAVGNPDPGTSIIDDYMTRDLVIGVPGDTIESAMAAMTEKRVRHLPVLDGRELIGVVSIGDVVKAMVAQQQVELHYLKDYVSGRVS